MVYTENGTYTAVRRRAPHPKLCPSQIGVFFLPHPVGYGLETGVRIPARARDLSLLQNVKPSCGAYPISCSVSTRYCFSGGKVKFTL